MSLYDNSSEDKLVLTVCICYEGLFQKLSTTLVKSHIGIATSFAKV
jgi:hypothetical protein